MLISALFFLMVVVLYVSFKQLAPLRTSPTRLLHPLVFPLLYMSYVLLVPLAYIALTNSGIASIPSSILTSTNLLISIIFVIGYVFGSLIVPALSPRMRPIQNRAPATMNLQNTAIGASFFVWFGRAILLVSLLSKIYEVVMSGTVFTTTYGENQLDYNATTAIAILGESLIAIGTLLIMYGSSRLNDKPLRPVDTILLVVLLSISVFLLGSRGEAIAPILLYVWFRTNPGKPLRNNIRMIPTILAGIFIVILFLSVSAIRTGTSTSPYPLFERLLWQTASPVLLSANVSDLVPASTPYYSGSTYIAAFKSSLPGPITRFLGDVKGTGALAYRDLINYTNPNQGWGFAVSTEAYLNFGLAGVAIVSVFVGILFSSAYNKAKQFPTDTPPSLSHILYPLLISYLPYGFRSDFLAQIKSVGYPIIIVFLVILYARSFYRKHRITNTLKSRVRHETP